MDSEEFTIEFTYKGMDYIGYVNHTETGGKSIFVVRYALCITPEFERLIELSHVVCDDNNPLKWEETLDDIKLKKSDRNLVRCIGEALEDREL